ncbi:Zn-ribbon domain-containing OB-fold protein [Microbacterium lacus]|uniref:DNA-binding protein n=1 Tax=Microbacterium lacus TaxID=415217 RepID=A0ABN2HFD3_9MICO
MIHNDRHNRARLIAPEIAPYLHGDEGAPLSLPRCTICGRVQWPPRPSCVECGGIRFSPYSAAPRGTLFSWTTTHRAPSPEYADLTPFTVVIVELDDHDGVRLLGRLAATGDVPSLRVGMRMHGARERDARERSLLTWRIDD